MKLLEKQYIEYLLFVVKNKTSNNLIKFVYFLWFVYFSSVFFNNISLWYIDVCVLKSKYLEVFRLNYNMFFGIAENTSKIIIT